MHLGHKLPQMLKGATLGSSFLGGTHASKLPGGIHYTCKHKVVVFESKKMLRFDSQSQKQSFMAHSPDSSLRPFIVFHSSQVLQDGEADILCFTVAGPVNFTF